MWGRGGARTVRGEVRLKVKGTRHRKKHVGGRKTLAEVKVTPIDTAVQWDLLRKTLTSTTNAENCSRIRTNSVSASGNKFVQTNGTSIVPHNDKLFLNGL